ncbi:hypothetical protein [Virgibacillus sp. JSM 102003]
MPAEIVRPQLDINKPSTITNSLVLLLYFYYEIDLSAKKSRIAPAF